MCVWLHRCLVMLFTDWLHTKSDGLVPREKSFHHSLVIEIKSQVKRQCFQTQIYSWKVNGNVSDQFSPPAISTKIVSVCVLNVHWAKACCRQEFVRTDLICAVEQDVLGFVFSFLWSRNTTLLPSNTPESMNTDLRLFSASADSLLRHNLKLFSHTTQRLQKEWGR